MENDGVNRTNALLSTMVGPLWARAKYSQLYPDFFRDEHATSLMKKVRERYPDSDKEFDSMEEFVDELMGLALVIRARTFDNAITTFLQKNPDATIINLGCGLDTTFSRVDNGKILWYDIDLPDAIAFRVQLVPETERSRCIPKSIFDYTWMQDISYESDRGMLIIAGGLFTYFTNGEIADLLSKMASSFPGGEILFDCGSPRGNWFINRRLKKLDVKGMDHEFSIKTPSEIESWSDQLLVLHCFSYFSKMKTNSKWSRRTRLMMKRNSWLNLEKFIHVKFLDINNLPKYE